MSLALIHADRKVASILTYDKQSCVKITSKTNKPHRRLMTRHVTSYHPAPNVAIDISLEYVSPRKPHHLKQMFPFIVITQKHKSRWTNITGWEPSDADFILRPSPRQNGNPTASFARKRATMCHERHSQAAARITWGLTSGKRQTRAFFPEVH